jgi:hypothetical protein
MDTSLTATFINLVGQVLDDVKRRDLATVNADLLRLKRESLRDELAKLKASVAASVKKQKAKAEQAHFSRGLGTATVLLSTLAAIDSRAAHQMGEATREYNRTIDQIALLEKKLAVQNRPAWWKRLWPL